MMTATSSVPPFQGSLKMHRPAVVSQGCARLGSLALGFVATPLWG